MAMVRLHLAHGMLSIPLSCVHLFVHFNFTERYHSLDTKMKSNPLSLEEVRIYLLTLVAFHYKVFILLDDFNDHLFMTCFIKHKR